MHATLFNKICTSVVVLFILGATSGFMVLQALCLYSYDIGVWYIRELFKPSEDLQGLVVQVHCWRMNRSYFEITHWAALFAPLCISITHQLTVLESCSNPQKTRQVF